MFKRRVVKSEIKVGIKAVLNSVGFIHTYD